MFIRSGHVCAHIGEKAKEVETVSLPTAPDAARIDKDISENIVNVASNNLDQIYVIPTSVIVTLFIFNKPKYSFLDSFQHPHTILSTNPMMIPTRSCYHRVLLPLTVVNNWMQLTIGC